MNERAGSTLLVSITAFLHMEIVHRLAVILITLFITFRVRRRARRTDRKYVKGYLDHINKLRAVEHMKNILFFAANKRAPPTLYHTIV